jgi:hypothetical protein
MRPTLPLLPSVSQGLRHLFPRRGHMDPETGRDATERPARPRETLLLVTMKEEGDGYQSSST